MAIHKDKPHLWKADVAASVDLYNEWFMNFAPTAFRAERVKATKYVLSAFDLTANLTQITPTVLQGNPSILASLRMATCPPIARDRLVGLSGVQKPLVDTIEEGKLPTRMRSEELTRQLALICGTIQKMFDVDLLPWIKTNTIPSEVERDRGATIIADRLCGAQANPIIRNAQEARQLEKIGAWLDARGYRKASHPADQLLTTMPAGTYAFRMNVRVGDELEVNIPVDVVVQPKQARASLLPILIEAKSAGDFTNTNKRRKEEAQKYTQLKERLGDDVEYVLFLCGYFDSGYLGYEAAEGIDWVWEHRIDDLAQLGL
jgi:hypothetical protein